MFDLQGKITDKFEKFAVYYHNLFDFPLSFSEIIKWTPTKLLPNFKPEYDISCENGYCYVAGRKGLLYKRILRKRFFERKMLIANKASKILSGIASIKMIAISGSLAMQNATKDSDIDLFIITKRGKLWLTRLITYLVLHIYNFPTRRVGGRHQKDRLCLNMWFDESDLIWKNPRNIYTAHEIAQLVPLINKNRTYEKFIWVNKWVKDFWPNAVKIQKIENESRKHKIQFNIFETLAFMLQYHHMKSKMTIEVVTPTRAIFHPQDWSQTVLKRLTS